MNKKALILLLIILVGVLGYKFMFQQTAQVGELVAAENAATELSEALKTGQPVFLEFYSDNCPACRKAKPWIEEFYQAHGEKVTFILADTQRGGLTLAQHFGVTAVPTFVLFNSEGKMLEAFAGYPPTNGKKYLEDKVKGLLE